MEILDLLKLVHLLLEEGYNASIILITVLIGLFVKRFADRGSKIETLEKSFVSYMPEFYNSISSIFGNTNEIKQQLNELEKIKDEIRKINRKVANINDIIDEESDDY